MMRIGCCACGAPAAWRWLEEMRLAPGPNPCASFGGPRSLKARSTLASVVLCLPYLPTRSTAPATEWDCHGLSLSALLLRQKPPVWTKRWGDIRTPSDEYAWRA